MAGSGKVERKGLMRVEAVESLYVSGSITTSGSIQLGFSLVDGDSDLILSSSATSKVVVSGNLDVLGTLTQQGAAISSPVTGSGEFFVTSILTVSGTINNPTGHLILSSSAGSVVASSGNLRIIGALTASNSVVTQGRKLYFGSTSANDTLVQGVQGDGVYVMTGDALSFSSVKLGTVNFGGYSFVTANAADAVRIHNQSRTLTMSLDAGKQSLNADGGHLILSSSAGSTIVASGSFWPKSAPSGKGFILAPNGNSYLRTDFNDQLLVYLGGQLMEQMTTTTLTWDNITSIEPGDAKIAWNTAGGATVTSHVAHLGGHLILSAAFGSPVSFVAVSGNLKVMGGMTGTAVNSSGPISGSVINITAAGSKFISSQADPVIFQDTAGAYIVIRSHSQNAGGYLFDTGGGSIGSPSAISDGVTSLNLVSRGWDTTGWNNGAAIQARAAGTWNAGSRGMNIAFMTVPSGSTTLADRWIISPAGDFYAATNNVYDIGSGSLNPRNIRVAGSVVSPSQHLILSSSAGSEIVASGTLVGTRNFVVSRTDGTNNAFVQMESDNGRYPLIRGRTSNGTLASPTTVTNTVGLLSNVGQGYNGSDYVSAVSVDYYATETWTTSNKGAEMGFATTQNGTNTYAYKWKINHHGHFIAHTDNSFDIGSGSANRPRDIFVAGRYVNTNQHLILSSSAGSITYVSGTLRVQQTLSASNGIPLVLDNAGSMVKLSPSSNGRLLVTNAAGNDFGWIQFGGTSDSFPGLQRDSAGLAIITAGLGGYSTLRASTLTANQLRSVEQHLILSSALGGIVAISGTAKFGQYAQASLPAGSDTLSGSMVWVSDKKCFAIYGPEGWQRLSSGTL